MVMKPEVRRVWTRTSSTTFWKIEGRPIIIRGRVCVPYATFTFLFTLSRANPQTATLRILSPGPWVFSVGDDEGTLRPRFPSFPRRAAPRTAWGGASSDVSAVARKLGTATTIKVWPTYFNHCLLMHVMFFFYWESCTLLDGVLLILLLLLMFTSTLVSISTKCM